MPITLEAKRIYQRRYSKTIAGKHASRRNIRAKKKFVLAAKNSPCSDCGVQYPHYVMDFDHVRGKKAFNISHAPMRNVSYVRMQAEIDKCEVVCSNCHRERSYGAKCRARVIARASESQIVVYQLPPGEPMPSSKTKRCNTCGMTYPLRRFYVNRECLHGVDPHCKVCSAEYQRKYRYGYRRVIIPLPTGYKYCTKCKELKKWEEFHIGEHRPDGLQSRCIDCRNKTGFRRRRRSYRRIAVFGAET